MCLPTDDAECRRWVEFVVMRWRMEHDPRFIFLEGICLHMKDMTRDDCMRIVRAYVDRATENKQLRAGQ